MCCAFWKSERFSARPNEWTLKASSSKAVMCQLRHPGRNCFAAQTGLNSLGLGRGREDHSRSSFRRTRSSCHEAKRRPYICERPWIRPTRQESKISFLSAAALVRQSLEINSSIESKLKEQRRLLSAASAIRAPSSTAAGGRKRDAIAEFSHREFGPVITSFEAIEEYPLGTPSWLALRTELEWSRKALYGQLRRWFGVLRSGCIVIKSNQRLGKQIGLSRKAVGEGLEELRLLRLIHVEGPTKGSRCVYLHWHPWMKNPEAVPTWAKLGQVEQLSWPDLARSLGPSSPMSGPIRAIKKRVTTIKTKNDYSRLMASESYSISWKRSSAKPR